MSGGGGVNKPEGGKSDWEWSELMRFREECNVLQMGSIK